ncbi:MAG: hypothetical protein ACOX30_07065 [Dethiobacteria bacterium]
MQWLDAVWEFVLNNGMGLIPLLVSFASLILAYMSLRLSVLKKGKPEIYPFIESTVPVVTKTSPDSFYFFFNIHYCIKNLGANPTAIYNLLWILDKKDTLGDFMISFLDHTHSVSKIWGGIVLTPYQQVIKTFACSGTFHIGDLDRDDEISLTLKYMWYQKRDIVRVKKEFPEFMGLINEVKEKARAGKLDSFRAKDYRKDYLTTN